ncbi:hypothetical protein AVEN_163407-1 [Araneus ventricosus]|uniref:Uncharacterized protein n=1 Tax=Araneus ventricosus TaxID=182803 RepID=A0A4Y2KXW3_ARAVE|nr:hypothetical protein AVEN_163407-1 [Araneus ventricosus]
MDLRQSSTSWCSGLRKTEQKSGRVTQGVKVTPLFPANANRNGSKTVFYLMVLRSSNYRSFPFPPMNQLKSDVLCYNRIFLSPHSLA